MKALAFGSLFLALVALAALLYVAYEPPTEPNDSLLEINWPIIEAWEKAYGSSPQSQRDYNFWLLGTLAKNQEEINQKFANALDAIDPNAMIDPNNE